MKVAAVVAAAVGLAAAGGAQAQGLANGGFELPAGGTNWTGSGWTVSGSAFREPAGARSGERGLIVPGAAAGEASCRQDIGAATGTYTFCGWLKRLGGFAPTNLVLRLEWRDAGSAEIQPAAVRLLTGMESDSLWHHVFVTGSCTNPSLAVVRAVLLSQHDAGAGGPAVLRFDDAELYRGAYTGAAFLVNGGFEYGATNAAESWFGSRWSAVPEYVGNSRRPWGPASGGWDAVLEGWLGGASSTYSTVLSQPVVPQSTGSWTYSVRMRREPYFEVSNVQLRLEWRDATYTNRVRADTVSPVTVAADNAWHSFQVTGSCADTNLFEVRAVAEFQYTPNASNQAMYVDDARLLPAGFTNSVVTDWAYHNSFRRDPTTESVPGTNGFGPFLQANYARTTTTFYVLSHSPDLSSYPDSEGAAWFYIAYQPPGGTNWVTVYSNMTRAATVELSTNTPFHGLPTNGAVSVDVWRFDWPQPSTNGVPYAEPVKVYYAPYFTVSYAGAEEDRKYLVRHDGLWTNAFPEAPQILHTNQWDKDYFYYNLPRVPRSAFTNDGFEAPAPVDTNAYWLNTGWQAYGDARRDNWAAHSGGLAAYLPGWFTNRALNDSGVLQAQSTTGGTCTFAAWLRSDPGVNPNRLELRLEWYGVSGGLVRADTKDLTRFPRDGSWHHVFVTGTCLAENLSFVCPVVAGQFWARTGEPDRVQVDDAQFYSGTYTGVPFFGNPSFEEGNPYDFRGSRWYIRPEYLANYRGDWGARRGTWCAIFDGGDTNGPAFETELAQNINPGTGTYTFAVWLARDTNCVLTNVAVKLGWYDATFTNRVQADSATNVVPPADNGWREFHVTGSCSSPDLYEVRASVLAQYESSSGSNGATLRADDGRIYRGDYVPPLRIDWAYHNAAGRDSLAERVPGGSWGPFLQVDYARTTTTFYVIAEHPTVAPDTNTAGEVGLRVSYWNPFVTNWAEIQTGMTLVGAAVVDGADPFHGLPSSGAKTVDLYRFSWTQPLNPGASPLTDPTIVYYCPYLRTYSESSLVENTWLLLNGEIANSYAVDPQRFGDWYYGKDYRYTNAWTADQDGDRIADIWEVRTFGAITNCQPGDDGDLDLRSNLEEYAADSNPGDGASYFRDRITWISGGETGQIRVDEPTTNTRLYDAYWKTNLLIDDPWQPCGLDRPGDGSNLWLVVTNAADVLFYRSGVRVP